MPCLLLRPAALRSIVGPTAHLNSAATATGPMTALKNDILEYLRGSKEGRRECKRPAGHGMHAARFGCALREAWQMQACSPRSAHLI